MDRNSCESDNKIKGKVCLFKVPISSLPRPPPEPKTSKAKMKEGIFVGPKPTQLYEYQDFSRQLTSSQRRTWKAFENVCRNFLGNEKLKNYSETVQVLISSYSAMGCNMSLNFIFCIPTWIFFLHTWEPSQMSKAKGSTKIFSKLKSGTAENGVQI